MAVADNKKPHDGKTNQADINAATTTGSNLVGLWISLLCVTQLGMFIYTKRAAKQASLPLFICLAQFGISAFLTALMSMTPLVKDSLRMMSSQHRPLLIPFGMVWTLAFMLLTASIARMSAALAGVVRSLEPLANLVLGLLLGERYSLRVVATLLPVCAGVVLAAGGGGAMTLSGLVLAMLSNFGFSARPFFAQRLKNAPVDKLDEVSIFFNVMCVGTAMLLPSVVVFEGSSFSASVTSLQGAGMLPSFASDVLVSCLSFFLYQFSQMKVMSQLNPLTFSVLTPISKAGMIVTCAFYFGDPFGASNAVGIVVATAGVVLFTSAKKADAARQAAASSKKVE